MRCKACDVALFDWEARRKDKHGQFEELCGRCLNDVMLPEYYHMVSEDADDGPTVTLRSFKGYGGYDADQ